MATNGKKAADPRKLLRRTIWLGLIGFLSPALVAVAYLVALSAIPGSVSFLTPGSTLLAGGVASGASFVGAWHFGSRYDALREKDPS